MSQATTEALESQAFGLMGRLHVQLRREIGRVTDIKYMNTNPEYCVHVLELALAVSNPELHLIAQKLEEIYFGSNGLFGSSEIKPRKLMISRVSIPVEAPPVTQAEPAESEQDQHYVGRLR